MQLLILLVERDPKEHLLKTPRQQFLTSENIYLSHKAFHLEQMLIQLACVFRPLEMQFE